MGFIYRIVVAGEIYIGSTKVKFYQRQSQHNQGLRNPNGKDYNYFYINFAENIM
jgi:predicted GIY-YIG superfamily endonuclease